MKGNLIKIIKTKGVNRNRTYEKSINSTPQ
jgi:hypothetical protein